MSENSTLCKVYAITEHQIGYALIGANIFASVMGTFGNVLVCIAVFTSVKMNSSFHFFITSLAVADLLICGVDQPLLAALLYGRIHSECMKEIRFVFRLVGNFACAISVLMLGLISLDRCLFVIRACKYKNTMTRGKRVALLVVWTLAIVYSVLRMTINKKITSYMTVVVIGVFYLIVIVSYVVIYVQVRKHRSERTIRETQNGNNDKNNFFVEQVRSKKERRFANTIILVVFVFSAAWAFLFYMRMTRPAQDYGILYNIGRTIALSSSACNPLLYCFMNSEYRRAFRRILKTSNIRKGYERIK